MYSGGLMEVIRAKQQEFVPLTVGQLFILTNLMSQAH